MKTINLVITLIALLLTSTVVGQTTCPGPKLTGSFDDFKLTLELAWVSPGQHNVAGKSDLEKILFPDRNSIVEFFIKDSSGSYQGFRVDTVSTNNYVMEVAWATGLQENDAIERREVAISVALGPSLWELFYYDVMKFYPHSVRIPASTPSGDYSVTLRCVVDDYLLWSFTANKPFSYIHDIATVCNEIVNDVREHGSITNEKELCQRVDRIQSKAFFNRAPLKNPRIPGFKLELLPPGEIQIIMFDRSE